MRGGSSQESDEMVTGQSVNNKTKAKARSLVHSAIKAGTLAPQPCEVCGSMEVHAHHEDYSKPLDVRWLCNVHHGKEHFTLRAEKEKQCTTCDRVAEPGFRFCRQCSAEYQGLQIMTDYGFLKEGVLTDEFYAILNRHARRPPRSTAEFLLERFTAAKETEVIP